MEESYTITVIEDQAVPLAATPGGGLPVEQTLFIIGILCVMAACAVIFAHRYLDRCRQLRTRLAQLNGASVYATPPYESAYETGHKYDLKFLESEVVRIEHERVQSL